MSPRHLTPFMPIMLSFGFYRGGKYTNDAIRYVAARDWPRVPCWPLHSAEENRGVLLLVFCRPSNDTRVYDYSSRPNQQPALRNVRAVTSRYGNALAVHSPDIRYQLIDHCCVRVRVACMRVCACARVDVSARARVRVCACKRVDVSAPVRVRVCACSRVHTWRLFVRAKVLAHTNVPFFKNLNLFRYLGNLHLSSMMQAAS